MIFIEKLDGFKKCFFVSNIHIKVSIGEKNQAIIQSCAVYQEQLFNLCGTFMVCLALRLWSHFSMASRWFWTLPNHLFRYWSENCADAKFIRTLDEWRGGCTLEHGGVKFSFSEKATKIWSYNSKFLWPSHKSWTLVHS